MTPHSPNETARHTFTLGQAALSNLEPRQRQNHQACDRLRCRSDGSTGVALLVLPGPAFVVIPVGLAILATEYAWARRWLRKAGRIATDVLSHGDRKAS
jgi:hypothetical protein